MKIVLLFSGGLDSTTLLYHLRAEGHDVSLLSVDYGQRHKKELSAAQKLAHLLGLKIETADISKVVRLISSSSQTSTEIEVPEGHYTEESMKATVVPNRNMIMLSIAMGWAIQLKANAVAYAAHGGDHAIYPDCRPEFTEVMRASAQLCDWHKLDLLTPFVRMSKSEIVGVGHKLQVPFELTWSCYKGLEYHCGKCGTCVERKEAFELANLSDPTEYRSL